MNDEIRLDPEQRAAVDHDKGACCVPCGPGSGKTRVVTARVERLLRAGVPASEIFACTFTKNAAREMLRRIRARYGSDGVRGIWCGTFHALCSRVLRQLPDHEWRAQRTEEFLIVDEDRSMSVFKQAVREVKFVQGEQKDWEKGYPWKEKRSLLSLAKQEGKTPDDLEDDQDKDIWRVYDEKLRAGNAFDFDDLLVVCARLFEGPAGKTWRSRFRYVLVDEYQDTNMVQYRIASALSKGHGNLMVVGDADQSIYGFRGADFRNILRFQEDFPGAKQIVVHQNYRSTANIVRACQAIIEKNEERIPKVMVTDAPPGELVAIEQYRDPEHEARWVAEQLRERVVKQHVELKELAVLYRNRRQSRLIEHQMVDLGYPYRVVGAHKFYERQEIKDCLGWLRMFAAPTSDEDFRRAIQRPSRKIGERTIDKVSLTARRCGLSLWDAAVGLVDGSLENERRIDGGQLDRLRSFIGQVEHGRQRLEEGHVSLVDWARVELEPVRADYEDPPKDDKKKDPGEEERRQHGENIRELYEAIGSYERRSRENDEPVTLFGYLDEVACMTDKDEDKGGNRVSLLTVHASKGLEFDYVWLIGCDDRRMPAKMNTTPGEERRVMYVACSRARKELRISWAQRRADGQFGYVECGPSMYIGDIPEDVCVRHW